MDTSTGVEDAFLGGPECVSIVTENEAQERIDLAVSLSDRKWIDAHQMFQRLLTDTDMTIGQILSSNFTQHEAHLFILSQSKILKAIQEDNTRRFHVILQGRFRGATPDMTTKLTMLYLGLPIEPIDFSLADLTYKMEIRKPEPPRYAVNPPLHFLTAHKERNWGNEILIGEEDQSYPVPVRPPQNWLSSLPDDFLRDTPVQKDEHVQEEQLMLRLRGGEVDDDSDWANDDYNDPIYDESDGEDDNAEESGSSQGHEEISETDDTDMNEIEDGEDLNPEEGTAPGSQHGNWINLYGFQGFVPFIQGDRQTYEDAIRKLLSLRPQDGKNFSIVHFDDKSNKVDTIHDSLPLKPDSPTFDYILEQATKAQPFFFVKLKKESAPEHWQPIEEQFGTTVSSVIWTPNEEAAREAKNPVSCCYLTFPTSNGSQLSQKEVNGWSADHYNAYIKAAFEVLLGRPKGPFHHAFCWLGDSNANFNNGPPVYGLSTTNPSDILSLAASGDGEPLNLRCAQLGENEVAFVLPCYHDTNNPPRIWSSKSNITKALDIIRQMVLTAFGNSAKHLKYVRLLDGRATLGPEISRNQKYHSIRMSDDLSQSSEIGYASVLSQIVAAGNPFVLLYPEWDEDQTFLYMQAPYGDDGADYYVQMPSLSSTVKEFISRVLELMRLAGFGPSRVLDVSSGEAFISIQPKIQEAEIAKVDAPCFFIGSKTTDEEWFSIRARVASPSATIKILDSDRWNWRAQVQKTDIWGPRYGLMMEAQAATKPEKKKVRWEEKMEAIQETISTESTMVDVPRASIEDGEPIETNHADWTQDQPHRKNAVSGSEMRKRTWVAQPSIFENYGLLPWPANSGIQFPMNAPPTEHMLRTGPRMPMVSKAILTPTEQGELQRITWDLRNICLNRTARCPYNGCPFIYRLDDENAIAKHLGAFHTARKCTWCDEMLPEHWDAAKIHRHVRENHKDKLMEVLGVSKATIGRFDEEGTVSAPLERVERSNGHSALASASENMIVETQESQESQEPRRDNKPGFCDRCGRDANYYSKNERAHHNGHCKPGIFNGAKCNFCTVCGKTVWISATEAKKSGKSNGQLTHCSHNVDDTHGPHCSRCGFNLSRLPQDGRDQHQKGCRGFSALSGRFCLYCGEEFRDTATQADWNGNKAHMVACYEKTPNVRGLLEQPDIAAFNQQQNNLRLQVNTVSSEEGRQGEKEKDLEDSDEEPIRTKPVKRRRIKRHGRVTTGSSDNHIGDTLPAATEDAGIGQETSQLHTPDPDAHHHNQESLRAISPKDISEGTFDASPIPSTKPFENVAQQKLPSRSPSRQESPDLPAEEKEDDANEPKTGMTAPLQGSDVSESDLDKKTDVGEDSDEYAQQSDDGESEDELQGDPSKSKRRKRGGKKRARQGDRDFRFDSEDDEDSESDEDGQHPKLPRRPPSPNWQRLLGPDDATFEPSEEYYCSKCFRKAPKKHKRDRSPLGRKSEIELHYDPGRCCGIRRGIGSTRRLPNRSGWIPSSLMPKPLSTLRKRFLRRYPVYARTVYPLNASNANGSYYRSDPNNDDNEDWWSIPWPPFRGPSPLPSGWVAPDVVDAPTAGKARQQFQLKPVPDPTYRQASNGQHSDDDDDHVESDKDANGKRKRKSRPTSVFNSSRMGTPTTTKKPQKTAAKEKTASTPRSVKKKAPLVQSAMKAKEATSHKVAQKATRGAVPSRRSTRKRQKTGDK
ncbi:hypothetical protein ACHAQJ_001867 [Trichoderma viride]